MPETAAPQSTETTPAATPPARGKGKGGAKTAAAAPKAPAAPATPPPAAAPPPPAKKPDAPAAAAPHPAAAAAADRRPEDTVAGRKQAEDAAKAAEEAAKATPAPAAGRSRSLEEVKAKRRARAAAAPAEGDKKDAPAAAAAAKPDAPPSPAEAATAAAAAATAAQDAGAKKGADKADDDEAEDPAEPAAAAAPAAEPAKPKTTEVDIPAEKLTEFTKLNRDLRTATARIRTLEADVVPRAEALKKAQELAAAGKHVDAIKAAGFDLDAAVREVLMVDEEGKDKPVDPVVKKLQEDLAKANEKLAKLEGDQSQMTAEAKAAALKAEKDARARGEKQIVAEVTMAADKFPYLSKSPKFVSEALDTLTDSYDTEGRVIAKGAYTLAKEALKRDLSDDEKNNLIRAALEEGEAGHAARAKLYGVVPRKPKKPADPAAAAPAAAAKPEEADPEPTTTDGAMRGSVAVVRPRGKRTLAEIKAERRKNSGR